VIKSNGYGFDLADAQSICLDDCPEVRRLDAALQRLKCAPWR
jgi:hypothetical protein